MAVTTLPSGPVVRTSTYPSFTSSGYAAIMSQLIGKPDETMAFPRSNTDSWGYQYYDTWGYMAIFSVTFDATGHAVSKFSRRINAGGDHSR